MILTNKKEYSKGDVRYYVSFFFDLFLMACIFAEITCYSPFVSDMQYYNGQGGAGYWLTPFLKTALLLPGSVLATLYILIFRSNRIRLLMIIKKNLPLFLLILLAGVSLVYCDYKRASFDKFLYFYQNSVILFALIIKDNSYAKTINKIIYLFSTAILLSYVELILFPMSAMHEYSYGVRLADELLSNWKGIFYHKNAAGGIFGFFALILIGKVNSSSKFLSLSNLLYLALLFLTVVFLWFSFAKGSMGALIITLVIVAILKSLLSLSKNSIYRYFLATVLCTLLLTFNAIATYYLAPTYNVNFTHRTDIWSLNFDYWMVSTRTEFFGHGFGSVYVSDFEGISKFRAGWEALIGSAHSGYVTILGELGLFGMALWALCIIQTIYNSFKFMQRDLKFEAWAISACLYFGLIRALTEPDIMSYTRPNWPILLILIVLVNTYGNLKFLKSNKVTTSDIQVDSISAPSSAITVR